MSDIDQYIEENTKESRLTYLTRAVEDWMDWFRPNNDRYRQAQDFLFASNLNRSESAVLTELERPIVQANVINAYHAHQVGEFSKNTPAPSVQPAAGDPQLAPQTEVVENHMRYIMDSTKSKQCKVFSDMLSGSFAIAKVKTKYLNDKIFDQMLEFETVRDNTLAGFDVLAREKHKGDGKYYFELYPKPKEEVEDEYGIEIKDSSFSAAPSNGFSWFYSKGYGKTKQKIVMVCDFYEKKYKYKMLYLTTDPMHPDQQKTWTREEYKEYVSQLEVEGSMIAPPQIIKKAKRKQTTIYNYKFIASEILEEEETDYRFLPGVFFDGNSIWMKDGIQMCIPFHFYAMDMQKSKNVCLQHIVNEIENMRMTDVLIPKEALPEEEEYQQAWLNPQKTNAALVYNQFTQNPAQTAPLNPPEVIGRGQVSQAVISFFEICDQTIQAILGSYDAQQGQQNNMSGAAIQAGATQSNNAIRPYIVNFLESMNQVLKIFVDLMPKYYTTARTIPVMDKEGNRTFMRVNDSIQNPMYKLEYEIDDLQVEVKMDATFEVQRTQFLDTITNLMKICPPINEFVGTPEGIQLILDNIEVKDISLLKEKFAKFWQQKQQQMAQAAQEQKQMAMMTNPEVNKMKIAEMNAMDKKAERRLEVMKTAVQMRSDHEKADAMKAKSESDILVAQTAAAANANKAQAESQRTLIEGAIALDKHAYSKIESEREHALEQQKHAANVFKTVGEMINEKQRNDSQKSNGKNEGENGGSEDETEEGKSIEES